MAAKVKVFKDGRHILPLEKFVNGRMNQQHANELACRLLGRTDTSKIQEKDQKIMVAESPHMTYVGKNYGKSCLNAKSKMKNYVGVYDEKTGKMRIYDTELFNMQPHIPGQEKDETDEVVKERTYKEKTDLLTTAFGSSRRKRALDTKTRHAVDDATLTGALNSAIDHGVQEVQSYKQKTEETVNDSELATTPPCNKEAEKEEDVYSFSDILSPNDLNDLHNSATEFFNCKSDQIETWRKEEKYPNYVLNKLETLPLKEASRWARCKCLLYMSYMLHLYRQNQKQLQKPDALPTTWPSSIRQKLFANFTMVVEAGSKKKRFMPSRLKDRLASYVMVLALIIDEFNLPLIDLQKDLRMGRQKIMFHARVLGCRVTQQKIGEERRAVAVLKLPLVFPTQGRIKRSR